MKFTLPRVRPSLVLVFTDIDGTKYYTDNRNDIVNKHGELVSLTEESNIRELLRSLNKVGFDATTTEKGQK